MDLLSSYRYFPATKIEDNGATSHQDPTVLALIFQDDTGGLEGLKDGGWIPMAPIEGALVFHLCDVLQVLTNDKFVSPFHQMVRPKGKSRYVLVFFYNLNEEKWVEPLTQFTKELGELPKYRRFQYKDYFGMRVKEKLNPPAKHEDKTTLITFASAT
ncbi:1-aminocyclopropane-1-carboxylate oxidase 1-like [Lycium barbarum]|uniref:1-aminocyclopropane-1-carboxylate oxidase 1-like n=1 Tax=Lycium barbarum TaxID=112863 RepID=UPI00293E4C6B|nr:1-aminocyclopropane-1-carboxylate oxidase 1-like [Lycium barbarum]